MTASADPTPALACHGLAVALANRPVLHDVDLALAPARWTSVVGPNGAGKSTLLKALAGLLPFDGRVELLGRPLASLSARQRGRALAWLGQNEATADDLSVYDVVMLGRLPWQRWLAPPSEADHLAVHGALTATQGWAWRERPLGQLSGGERQRVLLARALAVQADVLLMDEPVANLDPPHQADWWHTVRKLVAGGTTVVSVLHELNLALLADDVVIVADAGIVYHGASDDLTCHRALEAVFEQRVTVHAAPGRPPRVDLRGVGPGPGDGGRHRSGEGHR